MPETMETRDLQKEFLKALADRIDSRPDLANQVAESLQLGKDAVYRRLSGKVNFSAREIGILAHELQISLDGLIRRSDEHLLLPFKLAYPEENGLSMETLYETIDTHFGEMEPTLLGVKLQAGNIFSSLPLPFYLFFPELTKFMTFKWGNYFIGTKEFFDYSTWEIPDRIRELTGRMKKDYVYETIYYIWDEAIVWNLCREITNFHKMKIVSTEDKERIAGELKSLLDCIEKKLNGVRGRKLNCVKQD